MRVLTVILALAAAVVADDGQAARDELAAAEQALAADPGNALLQRSWAKAARAVARVLQRAEGYPAAMDFLETRLTHALTIEAYGEACLWGGQEERALKRIQAAREIPIRDRIKPELQLLYDLRRYDEAARRAREVGWKEWADWAKKEAAMRDRLLGRGVRAYWVAAIAFVVMAAAALALFVLAPKKASP